MKFHRAKLLLALVALFAFCSPKTQAATNPPTATTFFSPQTYLGDFGNGYSGYYLPYFNYYAVNTANPEYVYKFNFGFLYYFSTSQGDLSTNEAYFYDFTRGDFLYTTATWYPVFYSFNRSSFLYYVENSSPRQFFDFKTNSYVNY